METRTYQPGEIIFREGEESDSAYIVREGRVEIYKKTGGGTLLLAQLGEGEIFGEMGILSAAPRSAYAAAECLTTVSVISRESLGGLLQGQPESLVLVIRALMERLREANQKLSRLVTKSAQFQLQTDDTPPPVTRLTLLPMTDALKKLMPAQGMVLTGLPFRIGGLPEGEEPNLLDWNNLFLKGAEPHGVSRNHLAIQKSEGGVSVIDRGSKAGTLVNGKQIGSGAEDFKADLRPGDNEIIAGPNGSPYRFCLIWE